MEKPQNLFKNVSNLKFFFPEYGSQAKTSIAFLFNEKIDADNALKYVYGNYEIGDLSLNIFAGGSETIDVSFVKNDSIEEIYIGEFQYDIQEFKQFSISATKSQEVFLLFFFVSNGVPVFVAPGAINPELFILYGYNAIN